MSIELQIADVLEKMANYVEAVEAEKQAAVATERAKVLHAVKDKLAAITGEEVDENILNKLSSLDPEVFSAIEKLAARSDEQELGSPSDRRSAAAPMTKEEAAKAAEDRFASWCSGR